MLFVPRSLLRSYDDYQIIAADPENLATAWKERSEGFWEKIISWLPYSFRFETPEWASFLVPISVGWQKTTGETPERAQDSVKKALNWGFSQQKTIIKKPRRQGGYAFGIALQPTIHKDDVAPLQLPSTETTPVKDILKFPKSLLIIDASLVIQKEPDGTVKCYLSDYPPLLRKTTDEICVLHMDKDNMDKDTTKQLTKHSLLSPGWHPYCRVLCRYQGLNETEYNVQMIMLWLKPAPRPNEALITELIEEWKQLDGELLEEYIRIGMKLGRIEHLGINDTINAIKTKIQIAIRIKKGRQPSLEQLTDTQILENDGTELRAADEELNDFITMGKAYENGFFANCLGFMEGIHYWITHLRSSGSVENERAVSNLMKNLQPFPKEEWLATLECLRGFESVRTDEDRLNVLASALWSGRFGK